MLQKVKIVWLIVAIQTILLAIQIKTGADWLCIPITVLCFINLMTIDDK